MDLIDAIKTMKQGKKMPEYHQLYTIWGETLNPQEVLQEYPRPQLKRKNYTILNGYWDYRFTKAHLTPNEYEGTILVPFSPESVLSGVNRQLKPDEYLWYHRILRVHKFYEDKRCILHFGAVDQSCEVYINHHKIGEHMGGYLPFEFDITKKLKSGVNHIEVCVKDTSDTSYHSRGKQKLKRGGMFYTAQSGIWQTVWMEWVPKQYVTKLYILPDYDTNEVRFEVKMNLEETTSLDKPEISVAIKESDQSVITHTGISGSFVIKLQERHDWSPENPFLYEVKLTVGKDEIESYFAMRKISIEVGEDKITRIYLNGKPYFQNGVLDQGYWPDGLYTAPSDEAMIYDINTMKELGFNMIRKHIKIEPLRWYYHCDRLGMLVWQDMVNGGENYNPLYVTYLPTVFKRVTKMKDDHYRRTARKNKRGREEWKNECKLTVIHLMNCPCIVTWVPFNEGWGQFDAKEAVSLIQEMDRTRLIDHASGWFDQGVGDIKSIHNYFRTLSVELDHRAYAISEYGGYACRINEHSYSDRVYGYRRYQTMEEFTKAYHKLMEEVEVIKEQGLSAVVYTQLSDVEDEVNGLITYDRKIVKIKK